MDAKRVIEEYQDHLAPRLDTYEQAIYLYLLRHSRLQGVEEITVGFKSARRRLAVGVGTRGTPMSEGTCYEKLRCLEQKGCLALVSSDRDGTRIRIRLPSEIDGVMPGVAVARPMTLDEMDFFEVPENRLAILRREGNQCFYCLRGLNTSNYVIEHVQSRPDGDNSFRNVVAACRGCNNRKGSQSAEVFIRLLYREGYLGPEDLEQRNSTLARLRAGELRPADGTSS
jgi:hypothetical protein